MNQEKRVLVVDDDPAVLRALSRLLGAGFDVLTAQDATEALATAEAEPLDLVILDVKMPGVDGWAVASLMRESPLTRDVPILMLTGLSGIENRLDGIAAGADEYITKPWDGDVLWDTARRLTAAG